MIDILVKSADIAGGNATVEDYDMEEFKRAIAINLRGTFHANKAVVPTIRSQRPGLTYLTLRATNFGQSHPQNHLKLTMCGICPVRCISPLIQVSPAARQVLSKAEQARSADRNRWWAGLRSMGGGSRPLLGNGLPGTRLMTHRDCCQAREETYELAEASVLRNRGSRFPAESTRDQRVSLVVNHAATEAPVFSAVEG